MMTAETKDILRFFLEIFKIQSGLQGFEGNYSLVLQDEVTGDAIYELKVKRYDQWVSRRMTISPLGEESGSKSKCFKVIYDDVLVVKIPPIPITDFQKYLQNIEAEKRIADQLRPGIECMMPSVTAILKIIPPFSGDVGIFPQKFEEKCLKKLEIFKTFQEYLKIGKTFAFFMNLSKFVFLGSVISTMHESKAQARAEILTRADILGNPMAFEDIYGKKYSAIFFKIDEIHTAYQERLSPLLIRYGHTGVPSYHKKEWFLNYLAGATPDPWEGGVSREFAADTINLLDRMFQSHPSLLDRFRNTIGDHIRERVFKQNKTRMAGLITNLLRLLALLREKKVAMRDLKPDNVFVVGDLSVSPLLLAFPDDYSIGLIDFETSVILKTTEDTPQPMLAGTPSYATPSHVFSNDVLSKVYKDLTRIFLIQDWQAVNSMIFNVVTGSRLARETGRLMPSIVKGIKTSQKNNTPKKELFQNYSRIFWQNAADEFTRKIKQYHHLLKMVEVKIPVEAVKMFSEEAHTVSSETAGRIEQMINSQKMFQSPKSRQGLIKCPLDVAVRCKANWERDVDVPQTAPAIRKKIIELMDNLIRLKSDMERMDRFQKFLEQPGAVISAYDLIRLMFSIILNAMYLPEWGAITSTFEDDVTCVPEINYEATITCEGNSDLERTITQFYE